MKSGWSVRVAVVIAAAALFAAALPGAAHANQDYDEFTTTLPAFVTGPTQFEVIHDGPTSICSMTFNGSTITAAPWVFTYDPNVSGYAQYRVDVAYCDDSGSDAVNVETQIPFDIAGSVIEASGSARSIEVSDATNSPAHVVVTTAAGKVVVQADVPGEGRRSIKVPVKGVKSTMRYRVTVTNAEGLSMSRPLLVAYKWAALIDDMVPVFKPCSTITWFYDESGQPSKTKLLHRDLVAALKALSGETSLRFTEVDAADKADIVYKWKNMGARGPSGMGGPSTHTENGVTTVDGHVDLNTKDWWATGDSRSGAGVYRGTPGRVWLLVHETMHVLGFDHVNDSTQVMNPIGRAHRFGSGDLAGLHAMYPKGGCAKAPAA